MVVQDLLQDFSHHSQLYFSRRFFRFATAHFSDIHLRIFQDIGIFHDDPTEFLFSFFPDIAAKYLVVFFSDILLRFPQRHFRGISCGVYPEISTRISLRCCRGCSPRTLLGFFLKTFRDSFRCSSLDFPRRSS